MRDLTIIGEDLHLAHSCPDCGGDRDYPGSCDSCTPREPQERLDPIADYTSIHGMIDAIAARTVVHIDGFTLGQHPDAVARDEGKLMLLDWSRTGGALVADGWEAAVVLTRKTSLARGLGAALAAAVKVDALIADDLPLLSGLAVSADNLAGRTAGGPADAALRIALCARGLAFAMLGEEGDARRAHNLDFELRDLGALDRPEAWLGTDGRDFADLREIAFLPLTEGDRALLGAVC